ELVGDQAPGRRDEDRAARLVAAAGRLERRGVEARVPPERRAGAREAGRLEAIELRERARFGIRAQGRVGVEAHVVVAADARKLGLREVADRLVDLAALAARGGDDLFCDGAPELGLRAEPARVERLLERSVTAADGLETGGDLGRGAARHRGEDSLGPEVLGEKVVVLDDADADGDEVGPRAQKPAERAQLLLVALDLR